MKKIIFTVLMLTNFAAYSQTYPDLRPAWTKTALNPPAGANYFLSWGIGEGNNEQQAINNAWADALRRSLHELGVVGISNQDIDAVATKGIDAVVSFNKMKRRYLCVTKFIPKDSSTGKVYLLIQVQRSVHGKDDFDNVNTRICNDPDFDRTLDAYISKSTGEYPFSPRVFVPGMAQLYKGSKTKGVLFIVGEAALIGGIVASENLRASYASKINTAHNASDIRSYAGSADNWQNIRNGFIAGAAALYVWNVIDGCVAKGKKRVVILGDNTLKITPLITPYNGGVSGISLALNF
jgi:hypothetical protein